MEQVTVSNKLEEIRLRLYESLDPTIRNVLEKPHKCNKCGTRFRTFERLRDHKRTLHAY